MKKRLSILIAAAILTLLAGCSKSEFSSEFHDSMDNFYNELSLTVNALETIDPNSETAVDDMLAQLDDMSILFDELAAIEVPDELKDQFENVETLADEAAENMKEAASWYHDAYADGGYDEALALAAGEYYSRAMKRINYIAIVLQGRLPEGDNITVIPESDTPDWNGGESPAPDAAE